MDNLQLQFVHQQLLKGIRDIFSAQRDIAQTKIYSSSTSRSGRTRSGNLMRALQSGNFQISQGNGGVYAHIDYPIYIRFLDMKSHGNYKIYNRPIWGILYKQTLQNIRYEFRDWVRQFVNDSLSESFKP